MYLGIKNSNGSTVAIEGSPVPPPTPYAANFIAATGITDARQQTAIQLLADDINNCGFKSKLTAVYPFISKYRNIIFTPSPYDINWYNSGIGRPTSWNGSVSYPSIPNPVDGANGIASLVAPAGLKSGPLHLGVLYWNSDRFTQINKVVNPTAGLVIDTNGNIVNTPSGLDEYGVINAGNGWFRVWIKSGFSTYSIYVKNVSSPYIVFYIDTINLVVGPSTDISFSTSTFTGSEQIYFYGLQSEVNTIQQLGSGFGTPTNYQKVPYGVDPFVDMNFCYRFNFLNTATYSLAYSGKVCTWGYGIANNGGIIDTNIVPASITGMENPLGAVRLSSAYTGGSYLNASNIQITQYSAGVNDRIFGAQYGGGSSSFFELCNNDTTNAMFFGVNSGYGNSLYGGAVTDLYFAVKRNTGSIYINGLKNNTLFQNANPYQARVNRNIYLGSTNTGVSSLSSTRLISCAAFGIDLTDTEMQTLRTIMENYNIFLNRQ